MPSITQVLTWFHSLVYEWRWELFLSDPLIFIFWWFIIITVFIWGRGLFCGWLCPYGALTELAHKMAGAVGSQRFQFHLPMRWHDRLKWIKYGVFALLVVVSFYSIGMAEKMAEVEPFKSHLPGRRVLEPILAVRAVLGCAVRPVALHRAAVLQVPVPARRRARHPDHVAHGAAQAQGRVPHLPRLPEGLRLAGDRR